jgi:mxaJ protein
MFSRCLKIFSAAIGFTAAMLAADSTVAPVPAELCVSPVTGVTPAANVLRVASDPNNLPFSNQRGEGFENKIVDLVARELGMKVEYTWWAQRRGFFRHTLKEGLCDLVVGVPRGFDMALTTMPYYRSTYVFVARKDRGLALTSLDDPRLRDLQIGVQMVGDDFMNTPPAHALSRRGLIANVHGYTLYGDYRQENPPARIVEAVTNRDIDVALVWGPLAGFFSKQSGGELVITPVAPDRGEGAMPFAFEICMGVRKTNPALRAALNDVLTRKRAEIDAILAQYGVPRVEAAPSIAGVQP